MTSQTILQLQYRLGYTKQGVKIILTQMKAKRGLCLRFDNEECILVDSKYTKVERSLIVNFLIKALKNEKLRKLDLEIDGRLHPVLANKAVIDYREIKEKS